MTAVARPRNNLQQHLAWFNSQRPHIPPPGQTTEYAGASVATAAIPIPPSTIYPQLPIPDFTVRAERQNSAPTQPLTRNPLNPMPKRTESCRKQEEVEVIATEETTLPNTVREGALERIKRDIGSMGML